MNAYRPSAFSASPLLFFELDEIPYSVLFDSRKIPNHTHVIACSVPLVQMSQAFARVVNANETVLRLPTSERTAVLDLTLETTY